MKYIDIKKFLYMDYLIQRRRTGTPEQFAKRIDLSRSAFFEYLAYMRNDLDLDILYDNYSETYYYGDKDLCSVLGSMRCSECKERHCMK